MKWLLPLFALTLFSACKRDDGAGLAVKTYEYMVNLGRYGAAYAGAHPMTIATQVRVAEQDGGTAKIQVLLTNTTNAASYVVGFYTANSSGSVLFDTPPKYQLQVIGNGSTATGVIIVDDQFADIMSWQGYLVVHDPGQPLSFTNFATFLIIGKVNIPE